MVKSALGRGLGALLSGAPAIPKAASPPATTPSVTVTSSAEPIADKREQVLPTPLGRIQPSPFQPRKDFSEESLRELADSIKAQGIVQPLIVRQKGAIYELIAGERRWRAAQLLGLAEVPVIVREADDRALLELALIENLQRENLNALEEAQGYARLIEEFQLTQEQAAGKVGKSRVAVTNALRLLKLPSEVQEHLRAGRLSVGHAKVILGLNGATEQKLAAERIILHAWNVRQTEEFVTELQKRAAVPHTTRETAAPPPNRDLHVVDLENKLKERLGTKVGLRYRGGKGSIEIRFFNDEDLERILQIVGIQPD